MVCNLATVTYRCLKVNGIWDGIVESKKNKAFVRLPPPRSRPDKPPEGCFNCGENHWLDQCPKPIDQAKVDAKRREYRTKHPRRHGKVGKHRQNNGSGSTQTQANVKLPAQPTSDPKPKHISGEDGPPLILNRKGNYVLDQKRWDKLSEMLATLAKESKVPAPAAPPSSSTQTSGQGGWIERLCQSRKSLNLTPVTMTMSTSLSP